MDRSGFLYKTFLGCFSYETTPCQDKLLRQISSFLTSDDEISALCNQPFSIGGTAPPLMKITRKLTSKVSNQTYAANGQSMVFSTIPAGNLVIDLNKQTAEVSGTSIMQYFSPTGKFIDPVTGNITITGNGM